MIKKGIAGAIITGVPSELSAQFQANDHLDKAVVDRRIMGFNSPETSSQIPDVKLVGRKGVGVDAMSFKKQIHNDCEFFITCG